MLKLKTQSQDNVYLKVDVNAVIEAMQEIGSDGEVSARSKKLEEFSELLAKVAKRSRSLRDPVLDLLMVELGLYEEATNEKFDISVCAEITHRELAYMSEQRGRKESLEWLERHYADQEMTDKEVEQLSDVDNVVYAFICEMEALRGHHEPAWDISDIAEVRDLYVQHRNMTPQEEMRFAPWRPI